VVNVSPIYELRLVRAQIYGALVRSLNHELSYHTTAAFVL
jgi:hypothetical protein